ncbi:sigma-54-dependent transcriptional regulator [Fulvivirga lutimaris]|uniref:sigma-54-dependent transcriptional regulator n=1 Tax=Fulvivirga lutimaris TaxID=1819566 RepID=UPI0012BB8E2F|nr:sigma-54 dependent transcriptional regulator [Fulvivirga lutimaris]MTI39011.1 sigma-54-dependent Fis family transcriptional regulator [Fulvivirga lutimaris]
MKTEANILIIDDDRDVLETARMFLKQEFSSVDIEEDPSKIDGYFEMKNYDVILLDMNFSKGVNDGQEGFKWLRHIINKDNEAIVILITAYGEVDLAVKAMKEGASDFVLKPWKNQKLLATILSALELRKSKKEVTKLKATQSAINSDTNTKFSNFIGESDGVKQIKSLISKVAVTDADILILGENGTGKELVARAIHNQSNRKDNTFINVDLGALTESLFESELFGHVKGAFTDAKTDKVGRFELADGGTIFLDEIGNLSLPLQAKLLTVLQSKKIQRVGSSKEINVNFRLICATNMPLAEMVAENKFRQDLLYRINTVEIKIPALNERPEDIPLLIEHFFDIYSKKYGKTSMKIGKDIYPSLKNYDWPGNIRELQHATERAVILSESNTIDNPELFVNQPVSKVKIHEPKTLEDMEKTFIIETLEANKGNATATAKQLGLTRTALYRRLNKYGLV